MQHPDWTDATIERQLHNLYYAAGDTGSYGGVNRLHRRAHEVGIPATQEQVQRFLAKQLAYSLHKPARRTFPRNHTYVGHIDQQWQADLADMQKLADENDGYRYILTCIDVLSRYAWAVPVKSKSTVDMVAAVKRLLTATWPRKPQRLQTDKGKEFFNKPLGELFRKRNIHHFASNSDQKAAVVERFNRTLKGRIWTYFTANNTTRYVNVLDDLVYAYNHSVHRSIGMQPADVDNEEAAQKAWKALFYQSTRTSREARLPEQQHVRISRWKGTFEKGYVPNWSREHFTVQQRASHPHALYKLADTAGEPLEGLFYEREVQPIPQNTLQVDRVLRHRGRGARRQVLVKWRGWPDKFNRWIAHSELHNYTSAPATRHNE